MALDAIALFAKAALAMSLLAGFECLESEALDPSMARGAPRSAVSVRSSPLAQSKST
jgi:hypothetical protein